MPKRKPRTIIATGWGNPVFDLVDAQLLADGLMRLIEEANPSTKNVIR